MKVAARHALGCLAALALTAAPRGAGAWVDTHFAGDDVRIEVDRAGGALVDHAITVRVQGGPLRAFDVTGVDADAAPTSDSTVVDTKPDAKEPGPFHLDVQRRPDGPLRVAVDLPKGLYHGTYVFHVRYRTNLLGAGAIDRDGAMLRLRWVGASFPEGLDAEHCTIVLPASPTAPRAGASVSTGDGDDAAFTTGDAWSSLARVKRDADHDEIDLVRPHVARGERPTWTIRFDPKAMGQTIAAPPPAAAASPISIARPAERPASYAALFAVLVLAAGVVAQKASSVARLAREKGAGARALVPVGGVLRALLAGVALALGLGLQLALDDARVGTSAVVVATLLAWWRAPTSRAVPRGPGQWLPVGDAEAFAPARGLTGSWLDASTRKGKFGLALAVAPFVAAAAALARHAPRDAWLVGFDAVALVPSFVTGTARRFAPHGFSGSAAPLGAVARRLRKVAALRVVAIGRLPSGAPSFDELRLRVTPRTALRGLGAIEVGLVHVEGVGGFLAMPEILVRVGEGTPAETALLALAPGARFTRGRRAGERVASLTPRLPTAAMTASLVARLAAKLGERSPKAPVTDRVDARAAKATAGALRPATAAEPTLADALTA